jgi:hypothetical protein
MRKLSEDVRAYFRTLGVRGGERAAALLSPAQRKARATKASKAAAVARTAKKKAKAKRAK